jgi:hypothetical protein
VQVNDITPALLKVCASLTLHNKKFTFDRTAALQYNNVFSDRIKQIMKLVEFTYVKSDGSQSNRSVIEVKQPSQHFEGLDVSKMPEQDFALFIQEYKGLMAAHNEELLALIDQFDLKHNYRRFTPGQMQNVTHEYI